MHKKLTAYLLVVLLLNVSVEVFSQEKKEFSLPEGVEPVSFAVLPFLRLEGAGHIPVLLSRVLESKFVDSPFYLVIQQDSMNTILSDQGIDIKVERCADVECANTIAHSIGVDYVLMGTVSTKENHIELYARLVDTATDTVLHEVQKNIFDSREIDLTAELLVREISAVLYPNYIDMIGEANLVRDITPDTSVEPVKKEDAAVKDETESFPMTNGERLNIEPAVDNRPTWHTAGFFAGLTAMNIGNFFQTLDTIHYYSYLEAYDDYSNASTVLDIQSAWSRSQDEYDNAMYARITGAGFWIGGAGTAEAAIWLNRGPMLNMSARGRFLFDTGLFLQIAAGGFDLLGMHNLGQAHYNYLLYSNTSTAPEGYWNDYRDSFNEYMDVSRLSWIMRASGTIMQAGGIFWKAKNTKPLLSGFWDKMLFSAGFLLWGGGNISYARTMELEQDMVYSKFAYKSLPALDPLLPAYRSRYKDDEKAYRFGIITTASLWGSGALCFLTAMAFDFTDPFGQKETSSGDDQTETSDLRFSVLPIYGGIGFTGDLKL